ncbi:MAG: hypothetical protein OXC66_11505 [Roseovarius sp.]|nr:hypothetical protein [Roseovarius sp.]
MADKILLRVYLWGYSGQTLPRWMRRFLARTSLHQAWFLGFAGFFKQDGQ